MRIHRKGLLLKPISLQKASTELQFSPSGFEPLHIKLGTPHITIKWCHRASLKRFTEPTTKALWVLKIKSQREKTGLPAFCKQLPHPCKVKSSHLLFCLHHLLPPFFPLCRLNHTLPYLHRFSFSDLFIPTPITCIKSLIKITAILWHLNNSQLTKIPEHFWIFI